MSTPSGSSLRPREAVPNVWYGVWASRSQQTGLRAESRPDGLRVAGTLRFASGAGVVDRALIPVWLPDGRHLLLDLDVTDLAVDPTVWRTAAMQASRLRAHRRRLRVEQDSVVGKPDFILGDPASSQAVSGSPPAGLEVPRGSSTCCAPGIRAQPMRNSCGSAGCGRSWSRPLPPCALRLMFSTGRIRSLTCSRWRPRPVR